MQISIEQRRLDFADYVRKLILSWLLAATIEYILLPMGVRDLDLRSGLALMSFVRVVTITLGVFVILLITSRFWATASAERWIIVGTFAVFSMAALAVSFTWAFLTVLVLILAVLVLYAIRGWNADREVAPTPAKTDTAFVWVTAIASVGFVLFVGAWLVGRYLTFSTPTFDFGIFSQMYYNMAESGFPMTTVERDGLLSHFAVHVSPIYYLLLPIYWLAPSPATLQVLQPVILASAIIPLWKLCKHHGLCGVQRSLVCLMLLLYPAFSGGTSYDLHENCFLAPLILWLLYGMDKRNTAITAVAAVLTLMVKEDAAVYVAVAALWLIVKTALGFKATDRKDLITGIALLAVSLGWFFAVTGYLSQSGDGVMTYRYDNFIFDGSSSLLTVIKAVLLNPLKAVYECVDSAKLTFIAQTVLPLLGLPFLTRRYERYLLLIPYILVNLMSDYQYQHDVFFQYTFGSTAFLVYLTIVNIADLRFDKCRIAALSAAVLTGAVFFSALIVPKAMRYPEQAIKYYDYYQNMRQAMDEIPEDASVAAATFYTTYLSEREILYDLRYCTGQHILDSRYVVINPTSARDFDNFKSKGQDDGYENFVAFLEKNGYTLCQTVNKALVIYCRK